MLGYLREVGSALADDAANLSVEGARAADECDGRPGGVAVAEECGPAVFQ